MQLARPWAALSIVEIKTSCWPFWTSDGVSKSLVPRGTGNDRLAIQVIISLEMEKAEQYTATPQRHIGCFNLRRADKGQERKGLHASLNNRYGAGLIKAAISLSGVGAWV